MSVRAVAGNYVHGHAAEGTSHNDFPEHPVRFLSITYEVDSHSLVVTASRGSLYFLAL